MVVFGHRFIDSENFYHISDEDAILKTPPSSTIYLEFSEKNVDLIKHLNDNHIKSAIYIESITELIYISNLKASYAIVNKDIAKTLQNIAETYLLDTKILVKIKDEDEIESIARLGIDGVIFSRAIVKVNS